jgi:3-deoxy-manno-octulosonate cytidylyltransferase (CMP-KDO synthetase)
MSCTVIIPARYASTRFPGKPLHVIAGKPLLQHVWERCRKARHIDHILIATDDERISEAARGFGAEVCMTSPNHQSGTDRIAEAARMLPNATHIINVQGDEPLISPDLVSELAAKMQAEAQIGMITAVHAIHDDVLLDDPNVVKCVLARDGRALYFSRSRIPHPRGKHPQMQSWRHMGIYGFRRDFLEQFVRWEPSPLEVTESLEQLRALENGASIHVVITGHDSPGIDTPEQAAGMEIILTKKLTGSSAY